MGFSVGTGFGPFRVSSGVGGQGCGTFLAYLIAASALALVGFWPYLLGVWAAERLGASPEATSTKTVGWVLEGVYIIIIAMIVWRTHLRKKANTEAQELSIRRDQLAVCNRVLALMENHPQGQPEPSLPSRSERLLVSISHVSLVEPRAISRGGQRVPTPVDTGKLWLTTRAVRFYGSTKSVEWRLDRIVDVQQAGNDTLFSVTNRQTVSGIRTPSSSTPAFRAALLWAASLASGHLTDAKNELRNTITGLSKGIPDKEEEGAGPHLALG